MIGSDAFEHEERGYIYSDYFVSAKLFEDEYIKKYIRKNGKLGKCDFSGKRCKVIQLGELMPVILDGISKIYENANEVLFYDEESESGFDSDPIDSYELVYDIMADHLGIENTALLDELYKAMDMNYWTDINNVIDRSEQDAKWDKYCSLVNSCKLSAEQIVTERKHRNAPIEVKEICGFLDNIFYFCMDFHLIENLEKNKILYRCVDYLDPSYKDIYGITYIPASFIGTSLPSYANNNRMNEKGDSMFYGSNEIITILKELNANEAQDSKWYSIGRFCTNKRLRILDMTENLNGIKIPSLFDPDKNDLREAILFMKRFTKEVSKPKTDNESRSYKPTQVLTKYIQRNREINIAGIKYNSSKIHGVNYVIFADNENCIEISDNIDKTKIQMIMLSYIEPMKYCKIISEINNLPWKNNG